MQKDLKIKISIDKNTGKLKVVESEFDGLNNKVKTVSRNTNTFKEDLIGLAKGVVGIYAINEAFKAVIKTGFDYNSQLENAKGGLIALSVAIQDKSVPVMERYSRANAEATKTLEELQKINAQTPHTLSQTNQIYKAMYVSMRSVGASTSDLIELTKDISIASGAAGIEFNSLLAGVDGLATGTVLANSDLGRFLKGLGLTNEALKESKNVTKLLLDKLKDFKAMDTMTVAVSNFTNAWQQMAGEITKPFFTKTKQYLKDFTVTLDNNRDDIVEFGRDTIRVGQLVATGYESIFTASKIGYLEIALAFRTEIDEINNYVMKTIVETNNYWADTWAGKKAGMSHMEFKESTVDAEKLRSKIRESRNELIDLGIESDNLVKSIENNTVAQEKLNKKIEDGKKIKQKEPVVAKQTDNSSVKKFQDELNAKLKAHSQYIQIVGTEEEKFQDRLSQQMSALGESGVLTAQQLIEAFDKLNSDHQISLTITGLEESENSMTSMLDAQIALAESGMDWGNSLTGVAKEIANVSKATTKLYVDKLKYEKADTKLQNDYAEKFLKASGDELKQKEIMNEFDEKHGKLKQSQLSAELAGWSNLAGTMSSAFKQGSDGAIAMAAVQSVLGIASSWTAIAQAWALPFPMNLAAVPMVVAGVMPIISQLGGSGSAGGMSSGQIAQANIKSEIDLNKDMNKPITDRLDQQISLLQSIDRNGSAEAITVKSNMTQFSIDYANWKLETLQNARLGNVDAQFSDPKAMVDYITNWEKSIGVDVYSFANNGMTISANTDILKQNDNLIKTLQSMLNGETGYIGVFGQSNVSDFNNGERGYYESLASINQSFADLQGLVNDWAVSTIDTLNKLTDASDSLKDSYDAITGTNTYEIQKLEKAYSDFDKIANGMSYSDYLKTQIDSIEKANEFLTEDRLSLLLSKNVDDIQEQMVLVEEFSTITGETFTNGAEDVLNYIDAINLVSDAMEKSADNIKSWNDSFKSQDELLNDMAKSLGVNVATTSSELDNLFEVLKGGLGGLTDSELEFLNANKDALNANKDALNANKDALQAMADELNKTIDSFQSLSDSLQNKIDELNGNARGETYTLEQFYASMSAALTANPNDAEAYNDAIKDVITKSAVLNSKTAFETSRDQQFAQLVAANQFNELNVKTLTQIDYLKLISDNTYNTVEAVKAIDFTDQINALYQQELGRDATQAGLDYWANDLANGQSISDVATSIAASPEAQIVDLYESYGVTPDSAGVSYWLSDVASGQSIDDIANSFKTIYGYSNGGYTGDFGVNDIAGVVHGQEYVIDAPTTRDLGLNGNGGVFKEMVVELKNVRDLIEIQANEIRSLRKENEDQTQILDSIDRSVA